MKINAGKKARLLLTAACAALVLAAAGCGSTVGGVSSAVPEEAPGPASSYSETEDTLDGLCTYLEERGAIRRENQQEMEAVFIGAKSGYKFQFDKVTAEFYEYDTANLDDTAKAMLDSARGDGKITLLGKEVGNVTASDSGKYLMIYNNGDNSEEAKAHTEEVVKLFREFQKG